MKQALYSLLLIPIVSCASQNREQPNSALAQTEEVTAPAENLSPETCLDGQDMDAEDVDISKCPPIPSYPDKIYDWYAGSWEHGTTSLGHTYKFSDLSKKDENSNTLYLSYWDGGSSTNIFAPVDQINIDCWAKGYYRLYQYLKNPTPEFLYMNSKSYNDSFFQFQTDLRYGNTGFKKITSYQNGLVKWVTVIKQDGTCVQPTLKRFKDFIASEMIRLNLTMPAPAETPPATEVPATEVPANNAPAGN